MDGALHEEPTGGANRERHGSLAGRRILGVSMIQPQGGALRNDDICLPVWTVDAVEVDTFRLVTDSHSSDVLHHHDHHAV